MAGCGRLRVLGCDGRRSGEGECGVAVMTSVRRTLPVRSPHEHEKDSSAASLECSVSLFLVTCYIVLGSVSCQVGEVEIFLGGPGLLKLKGYV